MTRNQVRIASVILGLAGLGSGLAGCSSPLTSNSPLPELPDALIAHMEADVGDQIREAYRAALENPSNPDSSGRTGMVLHAYGYFESAAGFYRHALSHSPSTFRWLYYLGIAEAGAGRNEEAVECFRRALAGRPDDLATRLRLASVLTDLNRVGESLPLLQEVGARLPDNPLVQYELGRALAETDNQEAALARLSEACRLAPDFGAAHYALAMFYRDRGDRENAEYHLALFEQHRDTRPAAEDPLYLEIGQLREGVTVLLERARRLQEEGRNEEAIDEYRKVLQIRPEHGMAHASLMGLYRHLGRLAEGEAEYRSVLKVNPNIPEVHYNYAFLLLDNGQPEAAQRAFERALELNPSYADAHVNLAVTLAESGQEARAVSHLRKALEIDRNDRLARYNLSRLLLGQGQTSEAIELLSGPWDEDDAEAAEIEALLTTAFAMNGQWPEAETHARRALDLSEQHGLADLTRSVRGDLGKVLFQRGRYREAIDHLRSGAESESERAPVLLVLLAKCYSRLGNQELAARNASLALTLARHHGQLELAATIERTLGQPGHDRQ